MTDAERQEILDWIRSEHVAGRALNLHAVKRRHPDLLKRVYEVRPFWGWWQAIRDAGLEYGALKVELEETVVCRICGYEGQQLNAHLDRRHGIKSEEYRRRFPGAEIASEARRARMKKDGGNHLLPHWEPLYSAEYMMDRTWRYHEMGHRLKTTWICEHDHNLWQHVHRQGITWESFVTGLGISYPDSLPSLKPCISREEVIEELRRLRREEGGTPILKRATELNPLLASGIRRYFKGYDAALAAAGLPLPDRPHPLRREFSEDQVLEELKALSACGVRLTATAVLKELKRRDLHHAVEQMGGYPAVRARLGLADPEPVRQEVAHSREVVLEAMRRRAAAGKSYTIPSLREGPDADPELLRSGRRHFERWIDLLAAAGLEPEHHAKPRARQRREVFLEALRRHHADGSPLDRDSMRAEPGAAELYRRGCQLFKRWEDALEAAGLPAALAGVKDRKRDGILAEIRTFHAEKGDFDATSMKATPEGSDLYRRAIRAFTSWRKAVACAGLELRKPPKPPKATRGKTRTGKEKRSESRREPARDGRKEAVLEAIRERDRAKKPLYLRGLRLDPAGMELYREARALFRSWKAAIAAAGCEPAPRPPLPRSKIAEELELAYPIPESMYEILPSGRRRWRRRDETESDEFDPFGGEGLPPAAPEIAPPSGGMPRGWRFPKQGEKQRHTPSKASIRKKRKKGRR